jgi:multidrug efflux system outer membrane protein
MTHFACILRRVLRLPRLLSLWRLTHMPAVRLVTRPAIRRLDHWLASLALPLLASCAIIHHDNPPAAMIAPQQIRLADDIHLANEGWPSAHGRAPGRPAY